LTGTLSHGFASRWVLPKAFPRTDPADQKALERQKFTLDFGFRIGSCPLNEEATFLGKVKHNFTMIRLCAKSLDSGEVGGEIAEPARWIVS